MATEGGLAQAIYPEGGLTRDGRLREPKLGLLDYMLRSFDPDGNRDLVFIPVGLNYDRVLEDRTMLLGLEEDLPRPSAMRVAARTAGFAIRNAGLMVSGRWHRFGYACVNLGKPLSMRRYCNDHDLRPAELDRETRFKKVEAIAGELMADLAEIIPVVPVSIVATVFDRRTEPMSELELKAEAQRLMEELEARGARVYIPRRDLEYAIEVGLRMLVLRHIIEETNGLYAVAEGERDILAYYANSIAHLLPLS
jgi:glycerol-3-phosphate O-acyltransferase